MPSFVDFCGNLEYVALDKYDQDKANCLKNIERVYGCSEKKYYNNLTGLLSEHDKGSFDVIVLCNVLHEIDPKDWLSLFNNDISPLLKDDIGFLLHIEDMLSLSPIEKPTYYSDEKPHATFTKPPIGNRRSSQRKNTPDSDGCINGLNGIIARSIILRHGFGNTKATCHYDCRRYYYLYTAVFYRFATGFLFCIS